MAAYDNGPSPPQLGDFSKAAMDRAVLRTTLQHPLTLYPMAIGLVGTAVVGLLQPSFGAFLVALGGIVMGAGSWMVNYFFRGEQVANRYLQTLHHALAAHRHRMLERLQEDLQACQAVRGAAHFAFQGTEQFARIKDKFDNLQDMLAQKLNPGELTYSRYCGTAEQVYLSVLDNLQDVVTLLKSVSAIDEAYIASRLRELRTLTTLTETDRQEIVTLDDRQHLREQQLEKVNVLLTVNEEAMTTLDQTVAALTEMKTVRGRAVMDMEMARHELEQLARRAHRYSSPGV